MLPNLSTRPPTVSRTAVDEDLVLHVGAELGAILGLRRDRDVEVVAADVAAELTALARADGAGVAGFEVVGLRREIQLQRLAASAGRPAAGSAPRRPRRLVKTFTFSAPRV